MNSQTHPNTRNKVTICKLQKFEFLLRQLLIELLIANKFIIILGFVTIQASKNLLRFKVVPKVVWPCEVVLLKASTALPRTDAFPVSDLARLVLRVLHLPQEQTLVHTEELKALGYKRTIRDFNVSEEGARKSRSLRHRQRKLTTTKTK